MSMRVTAFLRLFRARFFTSLGCWRAGLSADACLRFAPPLRATYLAPVILFPVFIAGHADRVAADEAYFWFKNEGTGSRVEAQGSLDLSGREEIDNTQLIEGVDIIYLASSSANLYGISKSSGTSNRFGRHIDCNINVVSSPGTVYRYLRAESYSSNFYVYINPQTFCEISVEGTSRNGDTASFAGGVATWTGSLKDTLLDDEFHIEITFRNNKAIFSTRNPAERKPVQTTNLEAEAGDKKVILRWRDPNNTIPISKYQLRIDRNNDRDFGDADEDWNDISGSGGGTTSHELTGLENGKTYGFQVRAVNNHAEGLASETQTATPQIPAPIAPGDLNAVAGSGQVMLRWTDPENVTITGYKYRYKTDGDYGDWTAMTGITGNVAEATEFTVTGLDNGKEHTFQIRAANAAGDGPESAEVKATPVLSPPSAATLTASPGPLQVTLSWTLDPADASIQRWEYRQREGGAAFGDAWRDIPGSGAATRSHRVQGLTAGVAYGFQVRAVNAAGDGAASDAASATAAPLADTAPTFGAETITERSYTQNAAIAPLQLPQATDGNGTLSYSLSPSLPAGLKLDSSTRQITGTPTTAQPATTYVWKVSDADDNEAESDTDALTFTIEVTEASLPTVTLVLDPASILEDGGVAMVTARLDRASNTATVIALSVAADVTLSGDSLAIPAGATVSAGAVTVTAIDDDVDAADKQVTVSGSATGGVTGPADVTLTIRDDDAQPVVTLLLEPASIPEDGGVAAVTARLDRPSGADTAVTVSVAPAAAGDVTLGADRVLTIPAGQTVSSGAVAIAAVDNAVEAPDKAISIQATAANDLGVTDPEAVMLTITDDDGVSSEARKRVATRVLAEVGRAALAGAVEVLGQRFDAARCAAAARPALALAGSRVGGGLRLADRSLRERLDRRSRRPAFVARTLKGSALLRGSAFSLPLAASGGASSGPAWSVWGRGDWRSFEGATGAGRYDGSQRAGWLGLDGCLGGRFAAGLALSQSDGESDYRLDSEEGRFETALTALWPYLQLEMKGGGQLRLVAGAGRGEAEHRPAAGAVERADLAMLAASVGGRLPVARRGAFALAATGQASLTQLETDDAPSAPSLGGLKATGWRLSAGLEAAHDGLALGASGWRLQPRGALAVRQDGGDGLAGAGAELSAGARLSLPGGRFGLDASGHWLALHSEDEAREWGASLEARLAPGAGGRGLSLAFGPQWGQQQRGALTRERLFDEARDDDAPPRLSLTARIGYGFATAGGLLTPFAEWRLPARYAATGLTFTTPGGLTAFLTAEHHDPHTRLGIGLRFRF